MFVEAWSAEFGTEESLSSHILCFSLHCCARCELETKESDFF